MQKFIETIFKNKGDDESIVILHKKNNAFIPCFVDSSKEIVQHDTDMYVSCCTMQQGIASGRGKMKDVHSVYAFWIDIDFKDDAHKKENLPTMSQADEMIKEFPLPSIQVNSGYGYHLWYCLDTKHPATVDIQQTLKEFQNAFRQKYAIDSTHNLDRILRLPGTFNHKKNVPVQVTAKYNDVHYTLEYLSEYCVVDHKYSVKSSQEIALGAFNINPKALQPEYKYDKLCAKNSRFKSVFLRDAEGIGDGSPSAYDFSIAIICLKELWTNQEVVDTIIASRRSTGLGLPAKLLKSQYYQRTIEKAHARVEAERNESDDNKIDSIETVSKILGFNIKSFAKYLSTPPTYFMLTEFGNVEFSCIDELMSATKFYNRIAEQLDIVVDDRPKQKDWLPIAKILIENSEKVDLGAEGTDEGLISMLLNQYVEEQGISEDDDIITTSDIFRHIDMLCIHLESFRRYLDFNTKNNVNVRKLARICKKIGFSPVLVRREDRVMRVWGIKNHDFHKFSVTTGV